MKLQQIKDKAYFIIIPRNFVYAKNWKKGDNIKIEINKEGNLVLSK